MFFSCLIVVVSVCVCMFSARRRPYALSLLCQDKDVAFVPYGFYPIIIATGEDTESTIMWQLYFQEKMYALLPQGVRTAIASYNLEVVAASKRFKKQLSFFDCFFKM